MADASVAEANDLLDELKRARLASRRYAYDAFVKEMGEVPATFANVRAFIFKRTIIHRLSSGCLPSLVAHLRVVAEAFGKWHLSPDELTEVYADVKLLMAEAPATVRGKTPFRLTPAVITALEAMAASGSFEEKLVAAMALFLHNGFFRGGDVGDGAATRADIEAVGDHERKLPDAFEVFAYLGKTSKTTTAAQIGLVVMPVAVKIVHEYLAELDKRLPKGTDPKSVPLFPGLTRKGAVDLTHRGMATGTFVRKLNSLLVKYGVDLKVTGHSFRHGGKTDFLAMGLPVEIVDRLGRWTSDASAVYDRRTGIDFLRAYEAAVAGVASHAPAASSDAKTARSGGGRLTAAAAGRAPPVGKALVSPRRGSKPKAVGGAGVSASARSMDPWAEAYPSDSD